MVKKQNKTEKQKEKEIKRKKEHYQDYGVK